MGDADLKFLFFCIAVLTLYSAFVVLYAGEELVEDTPVTTEDKGLLGGIIPDINLDFINPFSEGFNSEFALINIFIFVPILLGIGIIGLRFLRGV